MEECPGWAWVAGGILALLGGAAAGWGIYEHNRANEEKKKRQDTEFDWQKSEYHWQNKERDFARNLQAEANKRKKLQEMMNSLLCEFEARNANCTPDEIDSMRNIFSIFANDGANIYATQNENKEYLLSDDMIRCALEICTALQNSPQLKQISVESNPFTSFPLGNTFDPILFQIESLKRRLNCRLADREKQRVITEEWQRIENAYHKNTSVQVVPDRRNKGGYICSIGSCYNAFMPNSHVTDNCVTGQPLDVLIREADTNSRKVIVSAKELKDRIDFEAFSNSNPVGAKILGKVVHILGDECHAALVSIFGDDICGYLPKTNVIGHPLQLDESVFSLGQEIEVYIKKIDNETRRVLLSMYAPQKYPKTKLLSKSC